MIEGNVSDIPVAGVFVDNTSSYNFPIIVALILLIMFVALIALAVIVFYCKVMRGAGMCDKCW